MVNIQNISEHMKRVLQCIQRPTALGTEFNVWQIAGDSFSVLHKVDKGMTDLYYAWIGAKILTTKPGTDEAEKQNRRFAVGIQWTGDELDGLRIEPKGECKCLVCQRLTKAVKCFIELAEEFDEGGAFPKPRIGRVFPPES